MCDKYQNSLEDYNTLKQHRTEQTIVWPISEIKENPEFDPDT